MLFHTPDSQTRSLTAMCFRGRAPLFVFITTVLVGCTDGSDPAPGDVPGVPPLTANSGEPAAPEAPLSARESDPTVMGWMEGFPPAPDRQLGQPDANYFSFPKLRWSVCHLREFLPTEQVSRGLGSPVPLEVALDPAIDQVEFVPMGGDDPMTWEESLYANYTDGMLILHRGRIVYERYFGCLDEAGQHAAMSMTKSMAGLVAEIMVAEGVLDESALVRDIVPELARSAFGSATVRQVMDMTAGVRFNEDYADRNADIWIYSAAASPFPKPSD